MGLAVHPMPSHVDLQQWDEIVRLHDDAYELVEGVPTMAPEEAWINRTAGFSLGALFHRRLDEVLIATDVGVTISEVPATVRVPDLVIFDRPEDAAMPRIDAAKVLFLAEVVSPGSVERDLVAKRRDYGLAGIPAYLVVDLRDGRRELTLYSERDEEGLFVDVAPREQVTAEVRGVVVDIDAADLLP